MSVSPCYSFVSLLESSNLLFESLPEYSTESIDKPIIELKFKLNKNNLKFQTNNTEVSKVAENEKILAIVKPNVGPLLMDEK